MPLAALACESRVQAHPAEPAILTSAYLVDGERVDEFRARIEELASRRTDVQVVVTGPWPPYSFVAQEATS